MGSWVDYWNNRGDEPLSSGTFTGTMMIPEVVEQEVDPCSEPEFAIDNNDTEVSTVTATRGGGSGVFTLQVPEVVDDSEPPTMIMLRPVKSAIELIGCNDVSMDWGANNVEKHDSYYVDREGYSWIKDGNLPLPLAGYISGIKDNVFYCYGGITKDVFGVKSTSDRLIKYDIATKEATEMAHGGLGGRFAPVGGLINGWLYVYGGFDVTTYPNSFMHEFHKVNIDTGVWNKYLSVNMVRAYNGMVIDGTKLIMGHAVIPHADNYWDYNGSTFNYYTESDGWDAPYNGNDYTPEALLSSQSWILHKGQHFHHEEGKLLEIIQSQYITTAGVELPSVGQDPMLATYGDYVLFYSRSTYANDPDQYEIIWFNTETRFYGTLDVIGTKPSPVSHFDMYVIDDYLYVFGGGYTNESGTLIETYSEVWKLYLKEFFDTLDTCGAIPVPPDTLRVKTVTACKEFAGHPCGDDGTYVRSYNDPDSPYYIPR